MKKKHPIIFILSTIVLTIILIVFFISSHSSSKLIKAIEKEDIVAVERLLEKGADANKPDVNPKLGWIWSMFETSARRPLAVACAKGNLTLVQLLVNSGATAEHIPGTGWSPLRETLFYFQPNDLAIVNLLLECGADPNYVEDELPVHAAAKMVPKVYDKSKANGTVFEGDYDEETAKGITEIVFLLLGENSVNITTSDEKTLLMISVEQENIYLAQSLMDMGCDITVVDIYGKTAYDYAVATNNDSLIALFEN